MLMLRQRNTSSVMNLMDGNLVILRMTNVKNIKISIGNLNLIFKMEKLLEEDAQKGTEYV